MTPRGRQLLFGAAVALVLFAAMALAVRGTAPWRAEGTDEGQAQAEANDLQGLVDSLFGPNVLAFEILGVLLTAAMIGALVVARPMEAPDDADRYVRPTEAQVAESDRASDPTTALEGSP